MADTAQSQRRGLLGEVVDRDEEALRAQALRHAPPGGAGDALHDGIERFLLYYAGSDSYEHARRWLLVAVKHAAWRQYTATASRRSVSLASEDIAVDPRDVAEEAAARERTRARLAALAALKPDEREALLLLGLGFSYAEIAARRGWTYTKVNRCIAEGRAALRAWEGGEN